MKMTPILGLITGCLFLLTGCNSINENAIVRGNLLGESDKDTILKVNYNPIPMHLFEKTGDEFPLSGGFEMNYCILEDINTQLIEEVEADLVLEDYSIPLVREVSDGYIIGVMETVFSAETTSKEYTLPIKKPVIYKIGKDGKQLWKQTYDYSFKGGNMSNLETYEDGRILFSISNWPTTSMGSPAYEKAYIIQCDQEGNELWKHTYDDYIGSLFKYIFLTEKEEIIGVGEWFAMDQQQTMDSNSSDIVVTSLDDKGNIVKQNSYGGENNEYCQGAVYDHNLGIVITGWTLSKTGDFGTKSIDQNNMDYIACIDESLNLKWVTNSEKDERYNYDQIVVKDNVVYVVGYSSKEQLLASSLDEGRITEHVFWQKFNEDGESIQKQYEDLLGWARLCVLENNEVVIGSGGQNEGYLLIYDNAGEKIKTIDQLEFAPHEIIATADQGFIVKSNRDIKGLPQPIYMSCMWMDVEVALVKYNSQWVIEWCKTYDDYKEEIRVDFVLPIGN